MARYIDADLLLKQLSKKKSEVAKGRYTEGFNDAIMRVRSMVSSSTTADVVPKSEMSKAVEKLMRATDKVICEAKAEVAREIFEERWIIKNSPFEMLNMAFKRLFPDVKYTAYFEPNIPNNEHDDKVCGLTEFADDGEITISIDCNLSINESVEIFAHELAHAGAGVGHEHDEVWEKAFDDLFEEYNKIGDEMFSSNINAPKGADYSAELKKYTEGSNEDN